MKATLCAVLLSFSMVSYSAFAADHTINLNKAIVSELTQSFKGIGKKRAQAIVDYRMSHGNFKSVEDLAQVRGFGRSFVTHHLQQLQALFVVS